jgi:hypothetical protein
MISHRIIFLISWMTLDESQNMRYEIFQTNFQRLLNLLRSRNCEIKIDKTLW